MIFIKRKIQKFIIQEKIIKIICNSSKKNNKINKMILYHHTDYEVH